MQPKKVFFTIPIYFKKSKTKNTLIGMNWYRNAHHFESNKIKKEIHALVSDKMGASPTVPFYQFSVVYKLYSKRRNLDVMNVVSIVDKFVMDGLVVGGYIADDSLEHFMGATITPAEIDSLNPRMAITVSLHP